ncbi:alkene reductase [Aquisediminimonas profunda]|uniref:alkene reductase n=1 Tax=Aquisediminimonas profunda TaxID=1550733 RepID=UPI001C627B2F|nr:alkene reductase [Aquisediminimonas profunda]
MNHPTLFSPASLGTLELPNRIVMAPMTRLRALGGLPNSAMADYYGQRADAGLIVTECTMVADTSAAYINAPGIFDDRFISGWRAVTDAVHEKNGRIFMQLWHCGRVAHMSMMPGEVAPLAPSPIAGAGELHTFSGKHPMSVPRAMSVDEIRGLTKAFGKAAERASRAGFDGVEIHGAFGYLIDQFLQDGSNRRNDDYGGSIENRVRFLLGIVGAVQQAFGANVGLKLSPSSRAHGMSDSDPAALFGFLLDQLNDADLAYVHMMEPLPDDQAMNPTIVNTRAFARQHYRGVLIANGGFAAESAEAALAAGEADLVSFGQLFIANPDLPERFARGAALAIPDFTKVYGVPGLPVEIGYSDYPRAIST